MLASTSVVEGEDELAGLTEEGLEETARYALFHWIYPLLTNSGHNNFDNFGVF